MAETNFFGMMDIWTNIAWVVIFIGVVVVLWLLHRKEKKRLQKIGKH